MPAVAVVVVVVVVVVVLLPTHTTPPLPTRTYAQPRRTPRTPRAQSTTCTPQRVCQGGGSGVNTCAVEYIGEGSYVLPYSVTNFIHAPDTPTDAAMTHTQTTCTHLHVTTPITHTNNSARHEETNTHSGVATTHKHIRPHTPPTAHAHPLIRSKEQ